VKSQLRRHPMPRMRPAVEGGHINVLFPIQPYSPGAEHPSAWRRHTMTMAAARPEANDLTAKARIREAALRLFAARGVERTSIRDVAREAGVSSGLVQHHYRTKEALRGACDADVLSRLVRMKGQLVLEGALDNPAFLADLHPDLLEASRYLARSMIDGSPAAAVMFTEMVDAAEEWLATHRAGVITDEHGYATLLVATEIGALALHPQLTGALGTDVVGPVGHLRLSRAKVEFYSKPLLDAGLAERAVDAIDAIDAVLAERAASRPPPPRPGQREAS
jgi:TetR/AcrR family transcriptional regulator, regulator of cefoperazone and chloramphenicol sensitivity